MKNPDKKNWTVLEIVRDFLYTYIHFQGLYKKFKSNTLTFKDVEKFISDKDPTLPLFNLKESCHMLFRYQENEKISDEEKLLDLAVGSIFHEAMKIRENLYLLEVYKPRYLQILRSKEASDYEKNLLQEFNKIGARTEKRLAESVLEVNRLLKDTLKQLSGLLPRYKDNPVLMRCLLRNKDLLQRAYGRRKWFQTIADIFPGGIGEAYDVEGKSYLESEHYDLAAEFFSQALKYKTNDQELKGLYFYARGMDGYYKNRYRETLRSFNRLLPIAAALKNGKGYLAKVEEICRKVGREYLEDKKKRMGALALQIAEKLQNL